MTYSSGDIEEKLGVGIKTLHAWARAGVFVPSVPARGTGNRGSYSFEDAVALTAASAMQAFRLPVKAIQAVTAEIQAGPLTGTLLLRPDGTGAWRVQRTTIANPSVSVVFQLEKLAEETRLRLKPRTFKAKVTRR